MTLMVQSPEDKKDSQDETKVTDAVDDEGLISRCGIDVVLIPKTNQGVGAKPHAFPTHKHEKEIVPRDEEKHGKGEEIEKGEEAPVRVVVVHIADGIDVDESPDPGYDENHYRGERVNPKSDINV